MKRNRRIWKKFTFVFSFNFVVSNKSSIILFFYFRFVNFVLFLNGMHWLFGGLIDLLKKKEFETFT